MPKLMHTVLTLKKKVQNISHDVVVTYYDIRLKKFNAIVNNFFHALVEILFSFLTHINK